MLLVVVKHTRAPYTGPRGGRPDLFKEEREDQEAGEEGSWSLKFLRNSLHSTVVCLKCEEGTITSGHLHNV